MTASRSRLASAASASATSSGNGRRLVWQPVDADQELVLDLSGWPGSVELRAAFAHALRHITGPIGTWQRRVTVTSSMWAVKALASWLAEENVTSVAEVSPTVWNAWRLHLTSPSRARGSVMSGRERLLDVRVVALALPGLRADTARAIEMRIGRVHRVGECRQRSSRPSAQRAGRWSAP